MNKSILVGGAVALLAVSWSALAAEPCRYSAPRSAEIDAAGLKLLAVEIGPDELTIRGEPGLAKIVAHGTACASDEKWLPDIRIDATRQGDNARLAANDGNHNDVFSIFKSLAGGSYAYLKLDVRVPESLAVKLSQGSGDANASGLAALDATLGSGDLKVDGISGAFRLRVGSGDVQASNVGSLDLGSLGSGDAGIDGVHGDARIGSVGSGDLHVGNVKGDVTLGSIGSGDVKLATVGGSVKVDSVASGDVVMHAVTGAVAVGSISSGDVSITQAGGNVHADSVGSGDFGADGVGGDFSVGSVGSGDIHHRGVKGRISVPRGDD